MAGSDFASALGQFEDAAVGQVNSCSKLSILLGVTNYSQWMNSVGRTETFWNQIKQTKNVEVR